MKNTDLKYLKNSFLHMLTEGDYTYSDSELEQWCMDLNLPLCGRSLFCVVVKSTDQRIDAEHTVRTKRYCEKIIAERHLVGYVVIGNDMDVILILVEYEKYSYSDFQSLHKALSQYLEFPVRLGIGRGRIGLSRLPDSKVEAYEALAWGDGQIPIADVRDLYKVRNMSMVSAERKGREILEQFKKGDLNNLEKELEALAEAVRSNTIVKKDSPNPSSIRRTMVELLVQMMFIASDAGVDVDAELDFVDPYRKIFEFKETPFIIRWVTEVAEILVRAMDVRQENLENDLLAQIKQLIEEHISDIELSLLTISRHVDMSPSYISAFFIREAGLGFKEYLISKRITLAKECLRNSNDSINAISEKCGFLTSSYFIRVFKQQTGMTPGAYRKNDISQQNY